VFFAPDCLPFSSLIHTNLPRRKITISLIFPSGSFEANSDLLSVWRPHLTTYLLASTLLSRRTPDG
jgi:hypothetical protein